MYKMSILIFLLVFYLNQLEISSFSQEYIRIMFSLDK